jgi:hypothetical protein
MRQATTGPGEIAFKEWASIVRALETGKQDLIFRKGGIAEEGRGFLPEHERFFLFPTYFHQQIKGIREEHRALLDEALGAKPPEGKIILTSWVSVKRAFAIEREADLVPLEGRHVYAPDVLLERLHARHGKTLYALEVETHLLGEPLELPLLESYAGCKSWLTLEMPGAK